MKKLAEFVIRYRWAVIVFFLALTAFMDFQMKNASFNPDLLTYLPEDLPSRVNQKQIERMFGGTDMVQHCLYRTAQKELTMTHIEPTVRATTVSNSVDRKSVV